MSDLRTFHPPSNGTHSAFAYRDIDLSKQVDREYLSATSKSSRHRSRQAWDHYDRIGEVRYGIGRSAKVAGYGRLVPERLTRAGEEADPDIQGRGTVDDIVSGIYGRFGGLRGLMERFYTLMKVTGEGVLIRVREDGAAMHDGYWVLSSDEIDIADMDALRSGEQTLKPLVWRTASATHGTDRAWQTREVQPQDVLGRIWNPSKRLVDEVDAPLHALEQLCGELIDLTDSIRGRLRSRFALSGMLLIPSEINEARVAGPNPTETRIESVVDRLITAMTRNVVNHDQAKAHVPAVLKGPAQFLKDVRHLMLEAGVAETDIKLRAELIDRILDGLDVQKQQARGNENSSHWNAWSNAEDERRIAVQPDLEAFAKALERAVLHRELADARWEPKRIRSWRLTIDLSDAAVKTNQAEDFRQGADRGWVGAKAGRRAIGAKETDAMDRVEYIRWVGKQTKDPYLALYGVEEEARGDEPPVEIDWDRVGKSNGTPGPDPDSPSDPARVGPGVGDPGSPNDRDSDTPRSQEPG